MEQKESSLERRLRIAEQKHGKGGPELQWLRDQIASQKKGKSVKEMYTTGMIKRSDDGDPEE